MIVCVITTASLGWVPILARITNFGIWWQLFIIKYLTIRDWNCNCQKTSHLALSSLIIIILLLHISVPSYLNHFYLILLHILVLVTFILSYLLVLDHLMLTLNKSHNILEKAQEVTTKLLYFVHMTGAKGCVALFE